MIVALQCGFFTVQQVFTADTLCGGAVTLDLTIPTANHKAFIHHLIGIYAPWDPGGTKDNEHLFWSEIANLCHSAKFSWSVCGDLNAMLSIMESTTGHPTISPACIQYSQFLHFTDGIDLWQSQPDLAASSSFYSCRTHVEN